MIDITYDYLNLGHSYSMMDDVPKIMLDYLKISPKLLLISYFIVLQEQIRDIVDRMNSQGE